MGIGEAKKRKIREIFRRHFEQATRLAGLEEDYLQTTLASLQVGIEDFKTRPVELPPNFPMEIYDSILAGMQEQFEVLN